MMARTRPGNRQRHWRGVFRRVMAQYDEIRSVYCSNSVQPFYESLGREGGDATNTGATQIVDPSPSDFICDVELAARRSLSVSEYELFRRLYVEKQEIPATVANSEAWQKAKQQIQAKVGKAFIFRKIHPTGQYFKGKDVR